MSKASDILRGRHCAPTGDERYRREMRAVADLMEALIVNVAPVHISDGVTAIGGVFCLACGATNGHDHGCKLAALERAITGESDAST